MKINGQALQAIRERSGLTQSELARRSAVSQNRISTIEAHSPSVRPHTAKALADTLGVPLAAILTATIEAAS